jgi:hypothetical protein
MAFVAVFPFLVGIKNGGSRMSGFPRGRASTGCFLALLVLAGGTGCVKRPFHEDAGTRSTEPKPKKESGGIKTYKQLLGEFGQEWVWMPASKITLYSVKRCPTSLGPVAEFHLRKTKQAARWDALWAVACVQKGKGLGFIYSGEINDNQDPSQNLINTVHVDKGTLGNRLPEAFAIKHAFGGCNMRQRSRTFLGGDHCPSGQLVRVPAGHRDVAPHHVQIEGMHHHRPGR